MNADLDRQLREMGPEYRDVVDRLIAAYAPAGNAPGGSRDGDVRRGRVIGWSVGYLVAASLLALLGFGIFFRAQRAPVLSTAGAEYTLAQQRTDSAIREMIRTQRPDGSWQNDFLTRQNAAALRTCSSGEARVAYKKAMRNMRLRGIL